jgi:hypothetical protein
MNRHKNQWGVIVGKPTRIAQQNWTPQDFELFNTKVVGHWIMEWDGNQPYDAVYDTREEARAAAKTFAKKFMYWQCHAKKYP